MLESVGGGYYSKEIHYLDFFMGDPKRGGYDPADEERAKAEAEKRNAGRSTFSKLFGVGKVLPADILRENKLRAEAEQEKASLQETEKKAAEEKAEAQRKAAEEQISFREAAERVYEEQEQEKISNVFKNAEKYAERMRAKDPTVFRELGESFNTKNTSPRDLISYITNIENLEPDSKAPELMEALAEEWKNLDKNNIESFKHSLCHFFDKYRSISFINNDAFLIKEKPRGLLSDKRWNHTTEILIKEVLSRVAEDVKRNPHGEYHGNNLGRIFIPLMMYNLDEVNTNQLETFPLKPEHSFYSAVADLIEERKGARGYSSNALKEFLRASSPKDLIIRLIHSDEPLPITDEAKAIRLLDAVKDDVSQEEMDAYIKKNYRVNDLPTDLETIEKNVEAAKEAKEQLAGLFVDVDGTLLQEDKVNMAVLQEMEVAVKRGTPVIVFTGGDPEIAAEKLKALGVLGEFANVKRKADFRGKVLERVIDDTDPALQGFKTTNWKKVF